METLSSDKIFRLLESYALPIFWAVVIFLVGRIIAGIISKLISKALRKSKVDETLVKFTRNLSYFALMALVIIASLDKLGVETTSFAAVIAAAGLAIGLSLQSSLSNFAAGVLLIVFRPFKVGDFIEAGGAAGIVEELQIFNTRMRTGDNKEVTVPNGQIISNNIINFSAKPTRRIDLVIGVSYGDDLKLVKTVLHDVLIQEARVLNDPEPVIGLLELGESSINFAVRPWVKTEDYWPTLFALQETIKQRFDTEGISIPFPQRDLHIIGQHAV